MFDSASKFLEKMQMKRQNQYFKQSKVQQCSVFVMFMVTLFPQAEINYLALTESLRVKTYDLPSVCGKASKCDIVIWHAG